jgi:acetyl esterase/lipase
MRRVGFLAVPAIVGVLALWHPARVAIQALLLLPAFFPSAPIDPLALITAAPERQHLSYPYAAGNVEADLFLPRGAGRHSALIFMLGAADLPPSDLALHFADDLARSGLVTLVPESSGMVAQHLTADEVDAIRQSLDLLDARPDVDPGRVGIVGLSASGGISIVAAAQADLRDRLLFVNSFGSYDDATSLLVDVASRSVPDDDTIQPWQPVERTVGVVANALDDAGASEADRAELLGGTTRDRALAIARGFAPEVRERLARVSPSASLGQVHAHLYLMHDTDDPFIPIAESRALVASAPAGLVIRYTEFSIFAHVIPDRPVPWQTFLPDLWRLFWHVHAVLLEVL